MKKGKFLVLSMLAIVLALGLAFVGCDGGSGSDGPLSGTYYPTIDESSGAALNDPAVLTFSGSSWRQYNSVTGFVFRSGDYTVDGSNLLVTITWGNPDWGGMTTVGTVINWILQDETTILADGWVWKKR